MRIIFVRHGEPDYEKDCLTSRGQLQAERAAKRLKREGISRIYSSPMGRAYYTAMALSKELGLPVTKLDFMHEITWGGEGVPFEGHPWTLSDMMICEEDFDFFGKDWRKHPYFEKNTATPEYDRVGPEFDEFLEAEGYLHEGTRFKCVKENNDTIAVFSHGGSGACVLAHILSLPFPYVCTVMPYDFTSIITLEFPVRKGGYVHPRIELFNDIEHIKGISDGLKLQQRPDK
jgi:probable phosphoglycerate mutase